MCGRIAVKTPTHLVAPHFRASPPEDGGPPALDAPRYNIAPTQTVITVTNDGAGRLEAMRWGLVPRWAKDPKIGAGMINARAETLAEKPAFREPLRRRRCLIPA